MTRSSLGWLALAFLLLTPFLAPAAVVSQSGSKWTLLVYMAADNDLEAFALADLDEMERGLAASGGLGSVNVVVLVDRSAREYEYGDLPPGVLESVENTPQWSTARVLKVVPDTRPGVVSEVLEDWGELNMGDPTTLARFLRYAVENFPAQRMVLIVWDHGSGPGVMALDVDNGGDLLTLRELRQALQDVGKVFDLMGFDACLMASMDTAYALRGLAGYMVASEETEPGDGWPYDAILERLSSEPGMSVEDLGRLIVDSYIEYYKAQEIPEVTLSLIRLNGFSGETFEDTVRDFVDQALSNLDAVKQARMGALEFGGGDEAQYGANQVDALSFLAPLATQMEAAGSLKEFLENSIVYNRAWGERVEGAGGLSLHFPLRLDRGFYTEVSELGEKLGWIRLLDTGVNVEAQVTGPPQTPVQLLRIFSGIGMDRVFPSSAGYVDMDGDGAQEFLVYGLGYTGEYDEYMLALSITKPSQGGLDEVFADVIEWGPPLEDGSSPIGFSGVNGFDVDNDGASEVIDAYYYYDGYVLYTVVDRIDYVGEGGLDLNTLYLDNFAADWSALGDFDGDGLQELALTGTFLDPDRGTVEGTIYIVDITHLQEEASFSLDHPEGTIVETDVSAGDLMGEEQGDELVITYNVYRPDKQEPEFSRLLVMKMQGDRAKILAGTEVPGRIYSVSVADMDGDGLGEMIVLYRIDKTYLSILKMAQGDFQELARAPLNLPPEASAAAEGFDLDGDGVQEVLLGFSIVGAGGDVRGAGILILGFLASEGGFALEEAIDAGQGEFFIPVTVDLEGDGRPEVVYVIYSQGTVLLGVGKVENYVDPTGTVRGRVIDEEGNPVQGARVKLSLPRSLNMKATTDENGEFVFEGVPAGTYQLEAYWRAPEGLRHERVLVDVKPGQETQATLTMKPEPQPNQMTSPSTQTPYLQETGAQATTTHQPQATQAPTQTTTGTQTTSTATTAPEAQEVSSQYGTQATIAQTSQSSITQATSPPTSTGAQPLTSQQSVEETAQTAEPGQASQSSTGQSGTIQTSSPEGSMTSTLTETLTQAEREPQGGGPSPFLYVQVLIVAGLALAVILLRRKTIAAAVAFFFIAFFAQPLAAVTDAQGEEPPAPPAWVYPGLRVSYYVFSGSSVSAPWKMGGFANINVMGLEGDEEVSVPEDIGKVSVISGFEVYVVVETAPGRVVASSVEWGIQNNKVLEGSVKKREIEMRPLNRVFNGVFWIDARLIAGAREGDRVEIPTSRGTVSYKVLLAGEYDLSPQARGRDNLAENTQGLAPLLPLPPGSVRDVVVLQGSLRAGQTPYTHTVIIDRETGLILAESLGSVTGGVGQGGQLGPVKNVLYSRQLSEVYLDLEDELPPYYTFEQDQYIHPGYMVSFAAAVFSLQAAYMYDSLYVIEGVYKDKLLVLELSKLVLSNMQTLGEMTMYMVEKQTGDALVLTSRPYSPQSPPMPPEGTRVHNTFLYIGRDVGKQSVEIEGRVYELRDRGTVSIATSQGGEEAVEAYIYAGTPSPEEPFSLGLLAYNEHGLLVHYMPLIYGVSIGEMAQQAQVQAQYTNTIDLLREVPLTQPQKLVPWDAPVGIADSPQEQEPAEQQGQGPENPVPVDNQANLQEEQEQGPVAQASSTAEQMVSNNSSEAPAETVTVTVTVTGTQEAGAGEQSTLSTEAKESPSIKEEVPNNAGDGDGFERVASPILTLVTVMLAVYLLRLLVTRRR